MHCGWREQYAKGWGVESHIRGNLGEELDLQERQGASVGEGRGEEVGHHRILPTPQRAHLPTSYQKAVLPSASPLPLPHALAQDLRLPAIPEGWPHHLQEATTAGAFPALACLPPGGATSTQSSTQHHQPPRKRPQCRKARTSSAQPCDICLHPEVVLPIQLPWGRAPWVLSGPASFSHPWGVLHA